MELFKSVDPSADYQGEFQTKATTRTNTRIARLPPQTSKVDELNKIFENFGYDKMNYISFIELPANVGYPSHVDTARGCNINFVKAPASPIIYNGKQYNWDRFFMDPSIHHEVPANEVARFTIMLTYMDSSYDEIHELLKRDGWV